MRRGGGGQVTPVFLYILPSLVMIWLHTKTQHHMLPGGAFRVCMAPPPLIWWRRRLLSVESKFSDRLWLSFSLGQAEQFVN